MQKKGSAAVAKVQMGETTGKAAPKCLAQGFPCGPQAQEVSLRRGRGAYLGALFGWKDHPCHLLKPRGSSGRFDVDTAVPAARHQNGNVGPGMGEAEAKAAKPLWAGPGHNKARLAVSPPAKTLG